MKRVTLIKILVVIVPLLVVVAGMAHRELVSAYQATISSQILDRNGETIALEPNNKGYTVIDSAEVPGELKKLLLKKEDRFFYVHTGINPVSMGKEVLSRMGIGERDGSSTITEQLAKLILKTETERTVTNKVRESLSAFALELFESKESLVTKYSNSVYMGNQIQGFETASRAYFNVHGDKLSTEQTLQLLATIANPSHSNPLLPENTERAKLLAQQLEVAIDENAFVTPEQVKTNLAQFMSHDYSFELTPWLSAEVLKQKKVTTTIDLKLTTTVREIIDGIMPSLHERDAHNAAVVVLDVHTNDILSLVGSPDPSSAEYGQQINMLTKRRQVASTIKPLLYARAFESGMRPYTLIDDRETAYVTADGRTIYPRNFDNTYRGLVTADYALANSINVPAIKTLEFLGQEDFQEFMVKLGYYAPEKILEHQLGSALGTIDMTLLEMTHYYSLFPNEGELLPLKIFDTPTANTQIFPQERVTVIAPQYAELVTKILSNRYLAIDQFGYTSNLSLPLESYALKTGTSDNYRDTWVIGYTPDFVVGVWVGNADNSSTKRLSGQTGAGEIWNKVMQALVDTPYHRNSSFSYELIEKFSVEGKDAYGLPEDDIPRTRRLLLDGEVGRAGSSEVLGIERL
jgi:membrane carboxypeptidase/penicillin-binding protein PbpC